MAWVSGDVVTVVGLTLKTDLNGCVASIVSRDTRHERRWNICIQGHDRKMSLREENLRRPDDVMEGSYSGCPASSRRHSKRPKTSLPAPEPASVVPESSAMPLGATTLNAPPNAVTEDATAPHAAGEGATAGDAAEGASAREAAREAIGAVSRHQPAVQPPPPPPAAVQLQDEGWCVLPLISADEIAAVRKAFWDAVDTFPEYLPDVSTASLTQHYVQGGFGALGTPRAHTKCLTLDT